MNIADEQVFGSSTINTNHWEYGVTDLVNFIAGSNSSKIKPSLKDNTTLMQTIKTHEPKIVVLLHSKVVNSFVKEYLGKSVVKYGNLGKLIEGCDSLFFNVPFPHGNTITSDVKVEMYKQIKETLLIIT